MRSLLAALLLSALAGAQAPPDESPSVPPRAPPAVPPYATGDQQRAGSPTRGNPPHACWNEGRRPDDGRGAPPLRLALPLPLPAPRPTPRRIPGRQVRLPPPMARGGAASSAGDAEAPPSSGFAPPRGGNAAPGGSSAAPGRIRRPGRAAGGPLAPGQQPGARRRRPRRPGGRVGPLLRRLRADGGQVPPRLQQGGDPRPPRAGQPLDLPQLRLHRGGRPREDHPALQDAGHGRGGLRGLPGRAQHQRHRHVPDGQVLEARPHRRRQEGAHPHPAQRGRGDPRRGAAGHQALPAPLRGPRPAAGRPRKLHLAPGRRHPDHSPRHPPRHRHRAERPAHREAARGPRPTRLPRPGPGHPGPVRPGARRGRQGEPDLRPGARAAGQGHPPGGHRRRGRPGGGSGCGAGRRGGRGGGDLHQQGGGRRAHQQAHRHLRREELPAHRRAGPAARHAHRRRGIDPRHLPEERQRRGPVQHAAEPGQRLAPLRLHGRRPARRRDGLARRASPRRGRPAVAAPPSSSAGT